jgi:hypothetical protein
MFELDDLFNALDDLIPRLQLEISPTMFPGLAMSDPFTPTELQYSVLIERGDIYPTVDLLLWFADGYGEKRRLAQVTLATERFLQQCVDDPAMAAAEVVHAMHGQEMT